MEPSNNPMIEGIGRNLRETLALNREEIKRFREVLMELKAGGTPVGALDSNLVHLDNAAAIIEDILQKRDERRA